MKKCFCANPVCCQHTKIVFRKIIKSIYTWTKLGMLRQTFFFVLSGGLDVQDVALFTTA